MNRHYYFLLVDAITLLIPLALSFSRRINFFSYWRFFLPAFLVTAIFFLIWNSLFIYWGIWSFNEEYTLGNHMGSMPFEELLFLLSFSYLACFLYFAFTTVIIPKRKRDPLRQSSFLAGLILLLAGIYFADRFYTFFSLIFCGTALLATVFLRRRMPGFRPSAFFIVFLLCLVPFLFAGRFMAVRVMQYNHDELLGKIIFGIPIENLFYGLLLMLIPVAGMEYFRKASGNFSVTRPSS